MLSMFEDPLLFNDNNDCILTIIQYNYSNYYFIQESRRNAMTKIFIFLCCIPNGLMSENCKQQPEFPPTHEIYLCGLIVILPSENLNFFFVLLSYRIALYFIITSKRIAINKNCVNFHTRCWWI